MYHEDGMPVYVTASAGKMGPGLPTVVPATYFALASVTKPIVAMAAAAEGLRVVTRSNDELRRVDIDDEGRATPRGAISPAIAQPFAVRAMGDDLLVHVSSRDDALLRWPR